MDQKIDEAKSGEEDEDTEENDAGFESMQRSKEMARKRIGAQGEDAADDESSS